MTQEKEVSVKMAFGVKGQETIKLQFDKNGSFSVEKMGDVFYIGKKIETFFIDFAKEFVTLN